MNTGFRLLPESASTAAPHVDALYYFLGAVTAFFTILIAAIIIYFAIRYRRRSEAMPPKVGTNYALELTWTLVPAVIVLKLLGRWLAGPKEESRG